MRFNDQELRLIRAALAQYSQTLCNMSTMSMKTADAHFDEDDYEMYEYYMERSDEYDRDYLAVDYMVESIDEHLESLEA